MRWCAMRSGIFIGFDWSTRGRRQQWRAGICSFIHTFFRISFPIKPSPDTGYQHLCATNTRIWHSDIATTPRSTWYRMAYFDCVINYKALPKTSKQIKKYALIIAKCMDELWNENESCQAKYGLIDEDIAGGRDGVRGGGGSACT